MDADTLAQKVIELRTSLDQFQQDITPSTNPTRTGTADQAALGKGKNSLPGTAGRPACPEEFRRLIALIETGQQVLAESQQQLQLFGEILRQSPIGLAVVCGRELVFRMANAAYQNMTLPMAGNLIGQSFEKVWPAAMGLRGRRLIHKLLNSGSQELLDRIEQPYPDGIMRYFLMRISRLSWYGEPGVLILLQETTQADRDRQLAMEVAEEAHRQAEELDAIIMVMAEAVLIFNPKGIAVRANPSAIDLFGLNPVGLDCTEFAETLSMRLPDGSPVQIADLPPEQARAGEIVIGKHILLIDNEGRERVVHASASPLYDQEGLAAVVTLWHDVTERERLLEQLEIEQVRLETIIKNAPEAILVADEDGRLVLGNPAAEEIMGRSIPYGREVESLAALNLCYADGTPYNPHNLPLTSSALDGKPLNKVEMQVIHPDGQVRNLLTSTAPIIDRKGNLNGAVAVFQDITQHKRAEEALRRQAARSQLLAYLSREFAEAGLNYRELLDTIVREVGRVFGDLCGLYLLDGNEKRFYQTTLFSNDPAQMARLQQIAQKMPVAAGAGRFGQVYRTGHPVLVAGLPVAKIQDVFPGAGSLLEDPGGQNRINALIVPLRARGRWIGVLSILRLQPENIFTREDQAFLEDLADRAALAIEGTWLYEREAQRARELQALHHATNALLSTLDLETLLAQILDAAQQAIPAAEQGVLYLLSDVEKKLEVRATFGYHNFNSLSPELQRQVSRSIREKGPLILNAIATAQPGDANGASPGSAVIAPLILDQNVIGALVLFGTSPKLFAENDLSLLDNFAATATAALQNAMLYAEVQRLATTDTVTEQFNRRKFIELGELEMHRFRRFHSPLSAIMLDLDQFKEINDTYGHGAGDQVLRTVAQRCRASIRVVDILGRYGGDEFAILLPDADVRSAREIAERIRQSVTQAPVETERGPVSVTISLGVTQAQQGTETLSGLLGRADAALYSAKESGRNQVKQD